jgi:hypothetical protein
MMGLLSQDIRDFRMRKSETIKGTAKPEEGRVAITPGGTTPFSDSLVQTLGTTVGDDGLLISEEMVVKLAHRRGDRDGWFRDGLSGNDGWGWFWYWFWLRAGGVRGEARRGQHWSALNCFRCRLVLANAPAHTIPVHARLRSR